jgi:subtilase family serine protease
MGSIIRGAPLLAAIALAACNSATSSTVPAVPGSNVPQWESQHLARRVCPEVRPGEGQCAALIVNQVDRSGASPPGWAPADIQAAYNLPSSSKGAGQIVAVVDAYDNPNVASDLAAYRSYYGLPPATFYKFNQRGEQAHYPKRDHSWGFETDLDVEMVSAACPNCTIYLVEADTQTLANLAASVVEAVKLGAHIVSNSWGCYAKNCRWKSDAFSHPNVTYLAASGDIEYASYPPAQFDNVVSVGGTVLSKSGSGYSEVVWTGTIGGCGASIKKPKWQHDPGCLGRTGNDIAAVAWGLAEYDSFRYGGWLEASGTSASTPIIAAAFALAGDASKQKGGKAFWTLSQQQIQNDLHYISSGANGCPPSLGGSYLCTAGTGQFGTYSGPTGWGTPNGIGAF